MFSFLKHKKPAYDFSLHTIVADWHCHVLAGIDDGAVSTGETLAMLRKYELLGITRVIATPHVRQDFYKNTKQSIAQAHQVANKLIQEHQLNVSLDYSAEYYADENFLSLIAQNDLLPIENQYILFELPMGQAPIFATDMVESIQRLGYTPVLAHPERYRFWHEKKQEIRRWRELGVCFQLNLLSLVGHYGTAERRMATWLVENDYVDAVGTDAHGMRHLEALEKLNGNVTFEQITQLPLLNK